MRWYIGERRNVHGSCIRSISRRPSSKELSFSSAKEGIFFSVTPTAIIYLFSSVERITRMDTGCDTGHLASDKKRYIYIYGSCFSITLNLIAAQRNHVEAHAVHSWRAQNTKYAYTTLRDVHKYTRSLDGGQLFGTVRRTVDVVNLSLYPARCLRIFLPKLRCNR